MRAACALFIGCLILLTSSTACRQGTGALAYYFRPPDIQKPEWQFPEGSRVALVIEAARPEFENPVFNAALHDRTVEMLRAGKSKAAFISHRAAVELRQQNDQYRKWSIQRIGQKLSVDYVLYARVTQLVLLPTPEYPLITPTVALNLKVIDVDAPTLHARVWPEEKSGRVMNCKRQTIQVSETDPDAIDSEARKLGFDTAYFVSMPFIKVDMENKRPVER